MSLPAFAHLASLGSSFAAGPGIRPVENRMAMRSARNYPHLLAERLGARLTDLTVSGATTATIVHRPQRVLGLGFPPQVTGVPSDVDLVTITAGGNDVNYLGSVLRAAYAARLSEGLLTGWLGRRLDHGGVPKLQAADVDGAAEGLASVVRAVRVRAPNARVLLVGYLTVLEPDAQPSRDSPFTPATRDAILAIADGLHEAFTQAVEMADAELVDVALHSRGHGLGSEQPWVRGFSTIHPAESFHPNLTGMQAVADAIAEHLAASRLG